MPHEALNNTSQTQKILLYKNKTKCRLVIQNVTHLQKKTRNQAQNNTQTHMIHVTTQNPCAKNSINKKNTNIHNGLL
jgi:hypothetical protein